MSRNLLHKSKLPTFLEWCRTEKGLAVRDGVGDYQLAQIQPKGSNNWYAIYCRIYMPEHVTIDDRLKPLVFNFLRSIKQND